MNKVIRDKTQQYNAYRNKENRSEFLGTATIDLPEISFISDAVKGSGISGEVEMPALGQTSSMSTTINWNTIDPAAIDLMDFETLSLDFRTAQQFFDPNVGGIKSEATRISIRGLIKTSNFGSLESGTATGGSTEIEIHYLKIVIAGKEKLEIDKFNMIYRVNGVDKLAEMRAALGE